ncbi:tRNA (adenine(22)-N(1))-methyltransferase [Paenibacillus sp. GCM10027627]|uniref:tRNA (adenine(22)-N(1))-methyltransferase n=1 Tax=unclassified Paenibacillus TaxID=185978 RepID=UPI00363FEDD2
MIKLSKRLQRIADYVTPGSRVADIGSDHALLPVYLLQNGVSPSAIAGELNSGPYMAAKKQAADAGLTARLSVRQGNGLAVLGKDEADTITIAGMGGSLMSGILEAGFQDGKMEGVTELVLQPNVGEDEVRAWLLDKGWKLKAESILEEDGKIYEVLHARKENGAKEANASLYSAEFLGLTSWDQSMLHSVLLRMGPYLLRQPTEVLLKKWRLELQKLERITKQIGTSELPEAEEKRKQFQAEMKRIEEVLACLSTELR